MIQMEMAKVAQPESVEQIKDRIQRMQEQIDSLEEVTETDSESEMTSDDLVFKLRAGFTSDKAGFKRLPDSENFSYDMEQGRGLRKQGQKVWKNKKAKQEVLRMLKRFNDENSSIQEKPLKSFKKLTEIKNSGPGPRIFIYREKNEQPVVVGFCIRDDLDAALAKLKEKFP
jgi:hypothetical protein